MKIGILQTGRAPDELIGQSGDYDALFRRMLDGHGFEFRTWAVLDMDLPDSPLDADGWLITGSKFGVYEDHPWIDPLQTLIRAIADSGRPMIGVCFGHQIIAQALGGTVQKAAGGWVVGHTDYDLNGKHVALNAWHQDQITELPEGAQVLGGNAACPNAVLGYGDTIWTLQPHPEFDNAFIDGLIRTRGRGVVPDAQLASAAALVDCPNDNAEIAAAMADFFTKERM